MNSLRFALIGDCQYCPLGNDSHRDCVGAKDKLNRLIQKLNCEELDFIICLGDIGDGRDKNELTEMVEVYRTSRHPVYYVAGNHDLSVRSAESFMEITGMSDLFYDFTAGGFRFIVLNAFEKSRYSPKDSAEYREYWKKREDNPWLRIQEWPGWMSEESWKRLHELLEDAAGKKQKVIIISHVPVWGPVAGGNAKGRTEPLARILDYQRMLDLLDGYPNICAYFAGHYHPGGLDVRKGVLHKTVRAMSDSKELTACLVTADERKLCLKGIGDETDFVHNMVPVETFISGTAPEGCWVMTNCGEIMQVGASGEFALSVPCAGRYALKAVMDGCQDVYLPNLEAPVSDLSITFQEDASRRLYTGETENPATLRIQDENGPIRWFDIDGKEYGSVEPGDEVWHGHCGNYWTNGRYAFTAGENVTIRQLPEHASLRKLGWYKGDLHVHLTHLECLYKVNIQQVAFVGRAEGYDWLYLATKYGNDGYPTDVYRVAEQLSGPDFLLGLNQEFPKARSNHFGNVGVEAPTVQADMKMISSLELAEKYIWDKGGITIPVHPFEGHMSCRELCLWILCAPEKLPCIDFFYRNNYPRKLAEEYWFMLLNRGYQIGCFATSDGAFDIGRTPGTDRGSTYVYMEQLSQEGLMEGIRRHRTIVSWDCAAIHLLVKPVDAADGAVYGNAEEENAVDIAGTAVSGDTLAADGTQRSLHIAVYWQKERRGVLRIIRNGVDIQRRRVVFDEDERPYTMELVISESQNCWYVIILETEDGLICSVTSPVRFRTADFQEPERVPFPRPCPPELIAECEMLTPEKLAEPETLDYFARKLKVMAQQNHTNNGRIDHE